MSPPPPRNIHLLQCQSFQWVPMFETSILNPNWTRAASLWWWAPPFNWISWQLAKINPNGQWSLLVLPLVPPPWCFYPYFFTRKVSTLSMESILGFIPNQQFFICLAIKYCGFVCLIHLIWCQIYGSRVCLKTQSQGLCLMIRIFVGAWSDFQYFFNICHILHIHNVSYHNSYPFPCFLVFTHSARLYYVSCPLSRAEE